ncbi:hypothetical protein P7C70_g550, partial [Phenoliferia sp. Uapishka_3]
MFSIFNPRLQRPSLPRIVVQWDPSADTPTPTESLEKQGASPIPATFTSLESYLDSFIPPLLLECWEQLRLAKREPKEDLIDLSVEEVDSVKGKATFTAYQVRGKQNENIVSWDEFDVLIVEGKFAVVRSIKTSGAIGNRKTKIKVHMSKESTFEEGESISARLVASIKTSVREYGALCQLNKSSLASQLVSPQDIAPFDPSSLSTRVVPGLDGSQSATVASVVSRTSGLSLIQGPPGTGKTTTILKIVEAWVKRRLLICAPSNAAVDEILRRLLLAPLSSPDFKSDERKLSIIRLGDPKLVSADVRHAHIDEVVRSRYGTPDRNRLGSVRSKVLREADVVCSTLSGCGSGVLDGMKFETVIVDEAGQAVEPSVIIPFQFGCTSCVLVGDPKQLPPTVVSRAAQRAGYERSLFERIMDVNPGVVHLLSTQYRMHTSISTFPSAQFYESKISDGLSMETSTSRSWHSDPRFPPYAFIDVSSGNDTLNGTSRLNDVEASAILSFYDQITKSFLSKETSPCSVGIITPYKAQRGALERAFAEKGYAEQVVFNTVDGFQGQEKDIIIISCVRAGPGGEVGFVRDARRMNVALTRAKSSVFIFGHSARLCSDPTWAALISDAKTRGAFMNSDLSLPAPASRSRERSRSPPHAPPPKKGRYDEQAAPQSTSGYVSLRREDLPEVWKDRLALDWCASYSIRGALAMTLTAFL